MDLLITKFRISEFNRWMLSIQKRVEDLNLIFDGLKELGYEGVTLDELLEDPDAACDKYFSEKAISESAFATRNVDREDRDNPIDIGFELQTSPLVHAEYLQDRIRSVSDWLNYKGAEPEEFFELEDNVVSISSQAEHGYFIRHVDYLESGEKVLPFLYKICDSLLDLRRYGINLHTLQDLLVEEGGYDVDMEAFEKFVESNDL